MCGILGKINLSNSPINDADYQLMNEVILNIKYRGPDGNGIKSEQKFITPSLYFYNYSVPIISLF